MARPPCQATRACAVSLRHSVWQACGPQTVPQENTGPQDCWEGRALLLPVPSLTRHPQNQARDSRCGRGLQAEASSGTPRGRREAAPHPGQPLPPRVSAALPPPPPHPGPRLERVLGQAGAFSPPLALGGCAWWEPTLSTQAPAGPGDGRRGGVRKDLSRRREEGGGYWFCRHLSRAHKAPATAREPHECPGPRATYPVSRGTETALSSPGWISNPQHACHWELGHHSDGTRETRFQRSLGCGHSLSWTQRCPPEFLC